MLRRVTVIESGDYDLLAGGPGGSALVEARTGMSWRWRQASVGTCGLMGITKASRLRGS